MSTDQRLSDIEVDDVNVADTFFALGDSEGRLEEINYAINAIGIALERLADHFAPESAEDYPGMRLTPPDPRVTPRAK